MSPRSPGPPRPSPAWNICIPTWECRQCHHPPRDSASPRVPKACHQLLTFESFSRNKRRARPARQPRTSQWKYPVLAKNPHSGMPGSPVAAARPRHGTAGAPATRRWFSGGGEREFRGCGSRSPAQGTGRYLNAADTGADDGAVVGAGAAGASLSRHPQEMEGAAVAGALGAFAGEGQKGGAQVAVTSQSGEYSQGDNPG